MFCSRDAKIPDFCVKDLDILTGLTKLTDKESSLLEGYLTIKEITKALKSMKNQKCPGVDRLPAEFFILGETEIYHFAIIELWVFIWTNVNLIEAMYNLLSS